ncbi:exported hypothetical protein [Candidatus Sulfobium mesophilum]|uniref:Uncharacterized protein n=1 Tax=Candidatus Sulfobium mesophilum TaxID=2016548 RepID=A0A2U3QFE7_9BACT|nr:exported hypothetical protein [Candidatus Sulfobium mesophilum]
MLKAKKSFIVTLFVALVLVSFGIASAASIGGLSSISGPAPVSDSYVNPDGLGDVLLFNYYNARSGMETFFAIVNTDSEQGTRVRVRFREAADIANSQCVDSTTGKGATAGSFEVLDFDVCLTAGDMWSGFVTAAPGGGAMLCSNDVDTLIYDGVNSGLFPAGCVPFKSGTFGSATLTADDTMEGYFEVIGEDSLNAEFTTCKPIANFQCTGAGTPDACCTAAGLGTCPDQFTDVGNELFGNAILIDASTSGSWSYDATAIADFAFESIQQSPTTSRPDLASDSEDGIDGINYILTKEHVFTIYDLIHARTEIVLTEPTKLLTQQNVGCSLEIPGTFNPNIFTDDSALFTVWNDSEKQLTTVCQFSPCPGGTVNKLPHEVNVLQMNIPTAGVVSDILDSAVDQVVAITFDFGWIDINLDPDVNLTFPHQTCFGDDNVAPFNCSNGWPVLGITLLDVDHGASTGAFPTQYFTDAFLD